MPTIEDDEFGTITVRKVSRSNSMKATVAPNGTLRLSVPAYAPIFMVKRMITNSRKDLRNLMDTRPKIHIEDGMPIGKSHTLLLRHSSQTSIKLNGLRLIVTLAHDDSIENPIIISEVRTHTLAILRKEAKAHLPKRIAYLAEKWGFDYSTLRFTHASSRWGSCNSNRAISLNIALMNLPFELIDYVLVHELSHTKHLNHSKEFWAEVARADQAYTTHRKQLKSHNPNI